MKHSSLTLPGSCLLPRLLHCIMSSFNANSPVLSIFDNHFIFAQVNDGADRLSCASSLSVRFQEETKHGIITISLKARFREYLTERVVHLRIPVDELAMELLEDSRAQIPTLIRQPLFHRKPKQNQDCFILSLRLGVVGSVLFPETIAVQLTPQEAYYDQVRAFQRLCKASNMLLYVPKHGVKASSQAALHRYIDLSMRGELRSLPLELARMYAGRGARQSDHGIFNFPDQPPPYQASSSSVPPRVTGKRRREGTLSRHLSCATTLIPPRRFFANCAGLSNAATSLLRRKS